MPRYHSVSSVKTYERCPQQWYFKYRKRVKIEDEEVPFHWRKGTVIHAGMEAAFLARKAAGAREVETMFEFFPAAEQAAAEAWVENSMGDPAGSEWQDTLRQIGESLEACAVPRPQDILGVEHKFLLELPGGIPMVGFADVALAVSRGTILIRDWKSNRYVLPLAELAEDFQGATYAALARVQWPWVERVYFSQFHTPIAHESQVLISDEIQADAIARIDAVVEMMESDPVKPRRGEACAECPFQKICPAWADEAGDPELTAMREF